MENSVWPMLLDYTKEDSLRLLRKLELEAYAQVLSTLRAQGELTNDKKRLVNELQSTLRIPLERHHAEIRRVTNDEKLHTIAQNVTGVDTSAEWISEGKRIVPSLPRLIPQTAFYGIANAAATVQARNNAKLPAPEDTGHRVKILQTKYVIDTPDEGVHAPKRRRKDILIERPLSKMVQPVGGAKRGPKPKQMYSIPVPMSKPAILSRAPITAVRKAEPVTVLAPTVVSSNSVVTRVLYVSSTGSVIPHRSSAYTIAPSVTAPRIGNVGQQHYQQNVSKASIIRTVVKSPLVATVPSVPFAARTSDQKHHVLRDGQIVLVPAGGLTKTITVPVSQIQRGSLTSISPLVLHPNPNAKGTATYTIQAFKPNMPVSKPTNLIVMPSGSSSIAENKTVLTKVQSIPKVVTIRQTVTAPPTSEQQRVVELQANTSKQPEGKGQINVSSGNVINIQKETFQKLIKNGQLPADILEMVQKAVSNQNLKLSEPSAVTSVTSAAPPTTMAERSSGSEAK